MAKLNHQRYCVRRRDHLKGSERRKKKSTAQDNLVPGKQAVQDLINSQYLRQDGVH